MINLIDFKESIDNVIRLINSMYDIEIAIFNTKYDLITCTKSYLQKKGKAVHAPSIIEAIEAGTVIVNTPGEMASCEGCRFKHNCPATVELLNTIKISDVPVGVIAFTSFTPEGYDKIISNTNKYTNILIEFSNLISAIVYYRNESLQFDIYISAITNAFELISEGIIFADTSGKILVINNYALELFSSCNVYTKSLYQLFDKNILSNIFSNRTMFNMHTEINKTKVSLSTTPIYVKDIKKGTIIQISTKKSNYNKSVDEENNIKNINLTKGSCPQITEIKKTIAKVKNSPSTIFITGETGTGKGLLAKEIHNNSNRAKNPFIVVNCNSIPENLFESEVFGYESGAFTGAKKEGKPGKFELANQGTLFLDEIGDMPYNLQSKLLNVLQDSTFERVGGVKPITVDTRIIAATNRDITQLVKENKFRSDLYYRLNIIPINLPPLRERISDIEEIAYSFLDKYNKLLNKEVKYFEKEIFRLFKSYRWPGNIRQLENIIEYCVNMADSNAITARDLPEKFILEMNQSNNSPDKIKESEYNLIVSTINKYGWDVQGKTLAAKELGIGLRTLYRRLKMYSK